MIYEFLYEIYDQYMDYFDDIFWDEEMSPREDLPYLIKRYLIVVRNTIEFLMEKVK